MSSHHSKRLVAAARPEDAAKALAARHGPPVERPALRKDLGIRRQVQLGDVCWIVKNPETMKYFMFRDVEWQLIKLFDGTRTREEVLAEYNRRVRTPIEMSLVLGYEDSLRRMAVIEESAVEKSLNMLDRFHNLRQKKAEEKSEGFNIFFIMFHVLDPNRFLTRTVRYVRWIWTPPVVAVTLVASVWTVAVFVQHGSTIWAETLQLYKFIGKPLIDILQFFLILCVIGCIHEFAHGYVVKIYGGEVHDIGMALFYFTPVFYCETSDSFMFTNKWHKFYVTVAGIYIEAIICSAATLLWVFSYPDTIAHQLAYKTMLLTGFATVFFNINPLIKVDGYNALASVLEMPGMREGSFRLVGTAFQKYVLRLPIEIPAMARRKLIVYSIYGALSAIYTASIMLVIAGWVSNFYYKFFPNFAVVLILLTLYYIFRKRVRKAARTGKLFYLDKKELIMSPRSRATLLSVAVVILLILFLPWSHRTLSAEGTLRPVSVTSVQAPEASLVAGVLVHEGDIVKAGQPVLQLVSPSSDEQSRRFGLERDRFLRKSNSGRDTSDAPLAYQSVQRASAAQAGLENAESRQTSLLVRSPIEGKVLTPRTEDLTGKHVLAGASLLEIGDCRRMTAEIGVSERLLKYLRTGEAVKASARTSGLRTHVGIVTAISSATAGQPSTATAQKDPSMPSEIPDRFTVVAVFDNADGALLPGTAARVKIRADRQSYASRTGEMFWRWIRTIVW